MKTSVHRWVRVVFWVCVGLLGFSGTTAPQRPLLKVELAFNLIPRWPSSGCTFAIIDHVDGKIMRIREVSERNFILIASGNQRSKANPQQVNFFDQYGIPNCNVKYDAPFKDWEIDCLPTQQPWKLRYQKRPTVDGSGEPGWAGKAINPTERQLFMLRSYGIQGLDDYAIGPKAFELLRDCSDPAWIGEYK